jgi:hypothetical protein
MEQDKKKKELPAMGKRFGRGEMRNMARQDEQDLQN